MVKGGLVPLDRHEVISPALKENLLRGLKVGMEGVNQDDFVHQILRGQNHARGGDLIGFRWGDDAAQKAALGVDGIDDFHLGVTHFLAIDDDDAVLRGT